MQLRGLCVKRRRWGLRANCCGRGCGGRDTAGEILRGGTAGGGAAGGGLRGAAGGVAKGGGISRLRVRRQMPPTPFHLGDRMRIHRCRRPGAGPGVVLLLSVLLGACTDAPTSPDPRGAARIKVRGPIAGDAVPITAAATSSTGIPIMQIPVDVTPAAMNDDHWVAGRDHRFGSSTIDQAAVWEGGTGLTILSYGGVFSSRATDIRKLDVLRPRRVGARAEYVSGRGGPQLGAFATWSRAPRHSSR